MTEYRKLRGIEVMQLKPGDWVAWRAEKGKANRAEHEMGGSYAHGTCYPLLSIGFCAIGRFTHTNREESLI